MIGQEWSAPHECINKALSLFHGNAACRRKNELSDRCFSRTPLTWGCSSDPSSWSTQSILQTLSQLSVQKINTTHYQAHFRNLESQEVLLYWLLNIFLAVGKQILRGLHRLLRQAQLSLLLFCIRFICLNNIQQNVHQLGHQNLPELLVWLRIFELSDLVVRNEGLLCQCSVLWWICWLFNCKCDEERFNVIVPILVMSYSGQRS